MAEPPVPAELCLTVEGREGARTGITIVIIPPLFDEANRTRRTLVLMMRALAAMGHSASLPDLPGQNDSLIPTEAVTLTEWRNALSRHVAALSTPYLIASWRGGALIDDAADGAAGWWRMAPQAGASIVKTLLRTRVAGDKEAGIQSTMESLRAAVQAEGAITLAGNRLSAAMLEQMEAAQPAAVEPLRSVMPGTGDGQVAGSPLWLRAEPGEDAAMAAAMARDIDAWAAQCVA